MGLVEDRYYFMRDCALDLGKTCSILYPEDNSFTFARNGKYLRALLDVDLNLQVAVQNRFADWGELRKFSNKIFFHFVDDEDNIEYVWTYIHNSINYGKARAPVVVGEDCYIHPTAIIGVHGNTYAKAPDGTRIQLMEIGGVKIGDRVDIEAYSIVHRSCFGNTIIEDDVKVCVQCNIGHNTKIGKRTYIAPGVKLGGGTHIGEDCFIWQGVITHSQIKICDKVMIGNGSYVHRSITESGIYAGSPAKYIKPFDEAVLKGEIQW